MVMRLYDMYVYGYISYCNTMHVLYARCAMPGALPARPMQYVTEVIRHSLKAISFLWESLQDIVVPLTISSDATESVLEQSVVQTCQPCILYPCWYYFITITLNVL